jgi:TATA-box binding protein (TBP) (component of TFIID and TFIIIB)
MLQNFANNKLYNNSSKIPDVIFTATNYRISTITATSGINTEINLKQLFDSVNIIHKNDNNNGIIYLEYGKNKFESISKGENIKKKVKSRKIKEIKRFDNQATAIIKVFNDQLYYVNMKIFKNGNIQMTGIKHINDGIICVNFIIDFIKNNSTEENLIVTNLDNINLNNYKVQLINSDFKINLEIKREILYKLLIFEYDIICSYEPCIYPGVKIQYFWNDNKNGQCSCEEHCSTKKKKAICKKITIAVFQSGCIIITGANTIEQINDSYSFICNIIKDNYNYLYKKPLLEIVEDKNLNNYIEENEIIYINKKSIQNPELLIK